MDIKTAIRPWVPKPAVSLYRRLSLWVAYSHDRRRFMRYSSSFNPESSQENLAAWMTMLYHNIEKGLSLPSPRPAFGADAVGRLIAATWKYIRLYGRDHLADSAVAALDGYAKFNGEAGLQPREIPHFDEIESLKAASAARDGGVLKVKREAFVQPGTHVPLEFFTKRSSVRIFDDKAVDREDLEYAARAAQKSPAVCNRQFSRVYISTERDVIDQALLIQGGARGFGSTVPAVAVITTSIRTYWTAGERMQPWTDGGMFAMSFVLGLHARGLGSVCLKLEQDCWR